MIEITIEGVPIPWKAPYVGSKGAYSPRYHEMKIIRSIVQEKWRQRKDSWVMLTGQISCDLIFYMPIPKSTSQKRRKLMLSGEIRPIGTPDRTNICKLYEDCLQGIVFENDSRIVDGRVAKYYGLVPCVVVTIKSV